MIKNVYGNLEKHEIFYGKPETDSLYSPPQYTVNDLHLHANVASAGPTKTKSLGQSQWRAQQITCSLVQTCGAKSKEPRNKDTR